MIHIRLFYESTFFVLVHKIRESIQAQRELFPFDGEIHIDGSYVYSSVLEKNKKSRWG